MCMHLTRGLALQRERSAPTVAKIAVIATATH